MVGRAQPREMDGWDSCCTLLTATCKDLACCGIHSTEYIVQNTYYTVHVHSRRMAYISSTGGVRVALAVGRSSASPWPFPGGRLPTIEPRSSEGGARRNAPPSRLARLAFLGLAFARGMAPLTGPDNRRHEKAPDGGVRVRRGRAVRRLLADSERPQLPRQAAFQTARTLGRVPGTWFSPLIGPLHAPEPVPRPCLRAGTSMEPVLACCAARTGISRGFEGPWAHGRPMGHGGPNGDNRSEGLETSGTHDCVWKPVSGGVGGKKGPERNGGRGRRTTGDGPWQTMSFLPDLWNLSDEKGGDSNLSDI